MSRVEIFSSQDCRYCEQARSMLDSRGIGYSSRDISQDDSAHRELLERLPHVRTLPQIFIDNKHIGSFEDLQALNDKGELDHLLE